MKLGFRQTIASLAVFGAILTFLVSLDERVRDRFGDLLSSGTSVSPLGHRAGELGNALLDAARHQSIENAPMMIFAVVGAVLVLFMVRT
jgi:hypothetical protein